jgi:hypothetical protein
MRAAKLTNANDTVLQSGNTPWSANPELMNGVSVEGPYFTLFETSGDDAFARSSMCEWDLHSEKEREWLLAFVDMYRYLKALRRSIQAAQSNAINVLYHQ